MARRPAPRLSSALPWLSLWLVINVGLCLSSVSNGRTPGDALRRIVALNLRHLAIDVVGFVACLASVWWLGARAVHLEREGTLSAPTLQWRCNRCGSPREPDHILCDVCDPAW